MSVLITTGVLGEIRGHLTDTYPMEGCGLLLGTRGSNGDVIVRRQLAVPNRRTGSGQERTRYLIAPQDYLAAEREAQTQRLGVVGMYHSHPDVPARPSAYDTEHAWPSWCYYIASVNGGEVGEERIWELRDDRSGFFERSLEVKET